MGSRSAFSKRRTWSAFLDLIPASVMRWLDDCEKDPWPTAARRISVAITKLLLKYSLNDRACKCEVWKPNESVALSLFCNRHLCKSLIYLLNYKFQ